MAENRFRSVADIIAFAVAREIEAAQSYARLAGLAKTPGLKELCLFLQGQEEEHRRLLEGLTEATLRGLGPALTADLHIVDTLADEKLADDMTIQELLIFAARKEKKAAELYESLARAGEGAKLKDLFLFLAGQEREHKLKLETEYEKLLLQED
ncbi:MAG TPA: ferritin family protein [Acidobacteriota bacterium]|nr:ferritin family protein [Acidobacteriota bacterium]